MQVGDVPSTAIRRGAPVLPWKPVRILLPHAADVHSVIVHPGPARRLEGAWFLPPGGEEFSPVGADPPPPPEPDPLIYGSDVPYPPGVHLEHGRQMKHGRSILCLSVCPVSYEPRSGRIDVLESLEVEVAIRRDASLPLAGRSGGTLLRPAHFADLASLVLNPPTEHEKRRAKDRGGGADDLVAYAVITTPELAPAFAPLVEARTAGGLPAAVFTTEWVYSQYSGLRPDGAQDDATRIRNFIADCYSSRGLEYVLLGGDADGGGGEPLVPTRYLQSRALFTQPIPADMYFGCLDGTFDGDGDGLYGEPDDGPDGDDVDFFCEVHVGRAPVDSLEEAESFVEKTIAYEESSDRVLREVLFVGEYLGFGGDYDWGGNLCDQIRSGSEDLFPSVGFLNSPFADFFRPRTLYDRDTLGGRWNRQALISILESGVHIVNHVGHADSSSVMRLSAAEIDSLAAGFPFLEYSQSCYAGAFDNQRPDGSYGGDSVAEHLLARRNGAAALVVNSRRGWASTGTADGPSHRFHRRFWHAVFQQGVLQWGAANDRSKEENLDAIQTSERSRFCAYELNTLGDPALTIHLAVSRGSLSFDRPFYSPGDFATVTLIDSDLDVSREEPDRASIEIRAETSGDTEVLELVETARASAVFRSSVEIATGVALADGRLQVTPPDTIIARYEDDDRGDGQPALAEAQLPAVDPVQLTGACPKDASVGVPYRDQLLAGGGLLPYRFRSSAASYVEDLVESPSPPPGSGSGSSVDRMPWFGDDRGWTYALPFEFPFYGRLHSSVVVSSNGYLDLGGGDGRLFANSVEGLIENKMIAPFWADLTVNEPGGIYIDEGFDWVSIQWVAQEYASEDPTSFWVTLSTDGRIVFGYGGANSGIEPTIGISAGNGQDYVISTISGRDDFSSAPRVYFIPTRLPGGLAVDAATGVISGVPEQVFSGEIALEVEDALGQRHRRVCHLEVRPDGLVLTAPQAGDLWLAGGRQTIRWEWFGNIGQNVQLDYNADGSTTAFPQPIAASVSIAARSLTWDLPARGDVPLPARIRIQSVERPEFFTYSEVFQIVGPTLRILVPAGGEKWQVGTQVVIRWQSLGNVGSRVRIDYNIDGSRTAFPLTLAADVPNSVEALVTVPGTPSETCRLRVQSLASPSVLDVSAGTFAIRSPSLRILSPNGGECMRTSESTLITWASEGLTGNEVILEYNTDGSEDVFPNAVGGGPLPNTGSAQWQTPASPSPSCRLRIRSASQPSIFDVSDGTFSIEHRCAVRALVWVPYIPQDEEQVTGMTDAILRYRPDLEPVYSVQLTPEALRTDLANKDALVIPKQKRGSAIDFAALGLRLGPVLREFLGRGGAVVIGQQTTESEEFLRATGLLTAERMTIATGLCEVIRPDHPLMAGVRPNFAGPLSTAAYSVTGGAVECLALLGGDTVVASRAVGFGRLSFLGFDYYSFNDDTARVLASSVYVPLPSAGIRLISPDPGTAFRSGEQIPIRWFALGEARGPVRILYFSGHPEAGCPPESHCLIAQADTQASGEGQLAWSAPSPPPGVDFIDVRLRVESLASPQHVCEASEPVYVSIPLQIETKSLPEANVGMAYDAEIRGQGGIPPYEFTVLDLPAGLIAEPAGEKGVRIRGVPQMACPNCEVRVIVEDSSGLTVQEFLALPVVVRQITVERPRGGELLLFGSAYQVRWSKTGDVGSTLTLSYNTDGSIDPADFPHVIASSIPSDQGSILWQVPAVTASSCRLKIESDQHPSIRGLSRGAFSIVGPSVRLDVPNGGECWEPGRHKRILWQSAGNDEGTVHLELSADGPDGEYQTIASGIPNTGEYLWPVLSATTETACVRISFENAPEILDTSDEPFRIRPECAIHIVHWTPCPGSDASDQNVRTALTEYVAEMSIEPTETRDPAALAESLRNRDALVVSLMSICRTLDYEELGEEFQPVLTSFVEEGGVVVFCGVSTVTSRLLAGLGLIERLQVVASRVGLPCAVVDYLHPVARDIALEFAGPYSTTSYSLVGSPLRPIVESQGSSVVSAADQALGRWVLLGFSFQSRDPDPRASELLLARAVRYRPIEDGLRVISPRPGDVFAAGDEIPIEWAAHGERAGTVRISCSTDGSTEEYPLEVALAASDAAGGSYLWTAPAPQPGSYYTCRLQVSWTDPPPLTASSEGEFFITPAPLQIETTSLANGFTGADYSSEIRVRGGAPPYLFDTGGDLPAGLYLPSPDEGQTHSHISGVPLETCSNRPVHLQVTDAAGTTLGRTYTITVSSSRIQILSPAGGEYLLAGGAHGVQWQVFGYVGDSVAVRYNTDGNSRDFPELAGESLPVHSAFTWQVPSGLRAERCRLQIESDLGYRSITERTFTISAAGITCLSPNGNEVLETGCQRMIRWRSLGNPGGRVRIELLVGLGAMSWSQEIVADTPDTGSFFWSVPLEPSEDCRIRVHSLADPLLDDVSDGLFSIRYHNPVRGLIWIPYTGFDQLEVRGAVAAVTLHENDFDWFLSLARQPEEVGAELVGKETFVMVQQTPAEDVNFAARGRAMSDVLQRFAAQGGTVVVLKQIGRAKEFLPASGLLNAVEVGHGFDVSAEVADPDHPVMNQLPSTFRSSTATAWYSITGEDVDVYATDAEGHPIVAGRDIGDGRVVVIGFDYRDYTPESARVIANAVRMVRATGRRAHFVRGDTNADGRIDIVDAIFLLRHLYHGGAEPPCLDAADVDDSALLGQSNSPIDLTDAIHLLLWLFVGGATPPPPTPLAPVALSPYCGTDPQYRDGLECASYPLCN